jgi:hydrogenase nickel incorporation protein HypB
MCTVCGCGQATAEGADGAREHVHGHDHDHHHDHAHHHPHHHHDHGHDHRPPPGLADGGRPEFGLLDYGAGLGGVHVPGMSPARIVQIEQDILGENDRFADGNRAFFAGRGILALNLVSSPGSGKTTLLVRTIDDLGGRMPLAVIEGDQQTSFDADRIRATGVPALQINTGKGCHLDAHMVGHGVERLDPVPGAVLFIENVGNLVCPAAFDLGEAHKVVMLSVTEGDDKPLKYPDMFHAADLMLLTKIDLLPHVPFDVDRCVEFARRINPAIEVIHLSATSGEGLDAWYRWIDRRRAVTASALDATARVRV